MSRKVNTALLAVLLLALTTAGCRSPREAARSTSSSSGTGNNSNPPAYVPQYYTSNFTCTAQGVTAKGQMRLQPDSVLWASASKVIELGRARLTRDSVVVYVKVTNSCFRGTYIDLYRRFKYRTSFDEVVKMATADDAEEQIAALIRSMNLDATVKMEPWQKAESLTFPLAVPANAKPL